MHPYGILIIVLQVACAVHVIRSGRPYWWLFIILLAPIVGALVYFLVEMLPDLRHHGRRAASGLARTIDPEHDRKRHAEPLAVSGTVENRRQLAEEYLQAGRAAEAASLCESCLSGVHRDDARVMLTLGRAQFALEEYARTRDTLDRLIRTNPDFKSAEGHLLYARSLEALGDTGRALDEYKVLAGYYPGLEAKCRYGRLLRQLGDDQQARELLGEVVRQARRFRGFYKDEREWLEVARTELAQISL